jgi:hypothetical protein
MGKPSKESMLLFSVGVNRATQQFLLSTIPTPHHSTKTFLNIPPQTATCKE